MENKKSILTGLVIASAILGLSNISANATTLTNYSSLGSGSELRAELLGKAATSLKAIELGCGEKKDAKGKDCSKAKDGKKCEKGKDGKCGEGKCGDSKKEAK